MWVFTSGFQKGGLLCNEQGGTSPKSKFALRKMWHWVWKQKRELRRLLKSDTEKYNFNDFSTQEESEDYNQ